MDGECRRQNFKPIIKCHIKIYEAISEEAESDPYTYGEAINDIDAHYWVQAMKSELDSMYSNQVWDL